MKSKNTHFYRLISSQFRSFFSLAALVSVLILFPFVTHGAEITLAWDANVEPDLAGYNIYYGTASGDYSDPPIDVGDVTEVTLTGFDDGGTYYFAATAYDEDDNESGYSDELVHTFSSGKPGNTIEAEDMPIKTTGGPISGGWNIWGNGYIAENMGFAAGGTFSFEVMARGDYAGGAWPIMEVRIDQTPVGTVTVDSSSWAAYRIQASITPGTHELAIAFINDYYNSPDDRNLYVDKVTITVAGGNLPPEASIIAGGINGIVPYLVNFDGSGSHDPDGEIISYDWVFGDGTIDSGDTVSHTFSDPGVYTVTLTVTDDQGATGSDTIQITASSGPGVEVEITASAGANGGISPSGNVTVSHGSNQTFTINADTNYHVQDVLVNGVSVGAVTSYTFTNVTKNHTIQASFAINKHTITATGGANGSISPSGSVTVNHGSNRTFTISADANYHVQDVLVDGTSVGAVTSYTFTNVAKNHTIQASFAINTHTITATGGANGSISPSGSVTVNHGSNQTFTINADANYHVQDVLVDGTSVGAVTSYTFTNVTQNHTIQASFAIDNQPPGADAGADQAVYVNGTVHLDGSGSSDADGDSLIFNWSIISKPSGSNAKLSNILAVKPTFDIDVTGNYKVQLVVNDGTVNSAPDTVTISTKNSAPVANAGAAQSVRINDTVQLDGSGSSDVDGDTLTFKWSIVSQPSGSNAKLSNILAVKPTFDIDVTGNYKVQLVVNDGTVNSAPDTVTISTKNSAPVANAGAAQSVRINDTVQLDGSGSSDVDGDTLTFKWSLVSKPGDNNTTLSDTKAVKPVFDVDVAGNYTVQLIVNDGTVDSAPDTVTISTKNSAPVANAGAAQSVRINDTVQLDGSGSSDVDGDTLTFKWSLVSKPDDSNTTLSDTKAVKPVFDVDVAGNYTVQLIVNDGTVDSAPDTVTISTKNSTPVANAGADQAVQIDDTVQLDGSGSSDVDGDTLTFTWSLVSKPGDSNTTLSDTKAVKPVFDVDVAGNYTVQLIVGDGTVKSAPDTVTISTENSAPVAKAGADQAVLVNDIVQLDGSASSDADGDTLTFNWSFISKPDRSIAVMSSKTTAKPSFNVDVAGTYTLQLIVNDGTDNSTPDTVTISTGNSPPEADAGADQAVYVNDTVHLDGSSSSDADGDTLSFKWSFTSRPKDSRAVLSSATAVNPTFVVDVVGSYIVQLIVIDAEDLQDTDTCSVQVSKAVSEDSDGDGVPDDQDAFPDDPDEYLDTDGDTVGNNADTDDDGDGMPDDWESTYGLDPLNEDDAGDDPDGDGVSNYDEYYLGTEPNNNEGNFEPYPPALIAPDDGETVSLTPLLETDEFYDPNYNDVHSQTQWQIVRAEDKYIVFDVTTDSSLTAMTVPKLILEYDTKYNWRVKFIDNHGGASEWSEDGYFTTKFSEADSDGNGIPDHQEVGDTLDLDKDGVADREQSDIKCIVADSGTVQIGISIRDAENIDSILSLEIEEPDDDSLILKSKGKPSFIEFGLLHFKLLLNAPGQETVVTIHLSRAAFDKGNMYKYDPVNSEWLDYSDYAEFSKNRKKVYLTLKDGGFGDADGIENGIIVDPLAFGSDSDPNSGSDSFVEDIGDSLKSGAGCFISAATTSRSSDRPSLSLYREFRGSELSIVFILMVLGYVGTEIYLRFRQKRRDGDKRIGRIVV